MRQSYFNTTLLLLGALQNAFASGLEVGVREAWTLVGTIVSTHQSKAVFQHASGTERLLIQGDVIAHCTLERIASKTVTLVCSDQRQSITLDYAQTIPEKRTRPPVQSSTEHQFYSISRNRLFALVQDRQRLVSQIALVPAIEDDAMLGYRVGKLRSDGDFAGLGLRNEDVITAVNGTPANQPEAFVQAVNSSGQMHAINLEVKRGDQRLTINYLLD